MIFVDEALYHKKKNQHVWEIGQSQAWTSAGTFSFTVPDSGLYDIIIIAGGAGGGGHAYYSMFGGKLASGGGGARSGESYSNQLLSKDDIVSVTVGNGGKVGKNVFKPEEGTNFGENGSAGGTSSFGNLSVQNNGYGTAGKVATKNGRETAGTGGRGTGSLGANGSNGKTGVASLETATQGASGYLYNGARYGAGGEGSAYYATGASGGSGLVVVTLVAYA